ncbi:hypothetical protein SAMN05192574_104765 [Mucilaginibacter gossypiicola]|uniref:Uncharacterized protein n=2 Tax=Mucilaginibacter gossypiicola TaxID=551995 RepID=A0A1H8KTZ3_9SPHI|nr:hypothetical protein SAMN05192574_104765 [Mucilaginibacter gossypiicola]
MLFLKREMPDTGELIILRDNKVFFMVPEGQVFQSFYDAVFKSVTQHTKKRKREADINFCVWSPTQERDFIIPKK